MILQAFLYNTMKICWPMAKSRPGWTSAKVSWALELDENGQLMALPCSKRKSAVKNSALLHVSCKFRNRLNALVV